MLGAVLTDEEQQAKAQAAQADVNRELAYREAEMARWTIIFTAAVGAAAAFGVGWAVYRRRKTHVDHS